MGRSKRPQGGCMLHIGDNLLPFFHSYTCNNSNMCKKGKDGERIITASFPCNICSTSSTSQLILQSYTSYNLTPTSYTMTFSRGGSKMDGLLAVLDTRVGNRTWNRRYGVEYS